MNAPSSWAMAIGQLPADRKQPEPNRHNPRPKGQTIAGSATCRVLEVLREIHPAALPHHELMRRAHAERGGVAWAIAFLRRKGMIETLTHPEHSRYLRYRWKPERESQSNAI